MRKLRKEEIQAAYRWASPFGQIILKKLFGKRYFDHRTIYERVRTFEDACEELGSDHEQVVEYLLLKGLCVSKNILAMAKLKIITKALNEGWPDNVDETDWRESKYYPYLLVGRDGSLHLSHVFPDCFAYLKTLFYYKTELLAKYSVDTFTDIWTDLYGWEHIEDKIKEDDFDYDMA